MLPRSVPLFSRKSAFGGGRLVPVALAGLLLAGCANQTPVIPMLRVEPMAAARFLYFEKRAAALLGPQKGKTGPQVSSARCTAVEPVLRTWGAPDAPAAAAEASDDEEEEDEDAAGPSAGGSAAPAPSEGPGSGAGPGQASATSTSRYPCDSSPND